MIIFLHRRMGLAPVTKELIASTDCLSRCVTFSVISVAVQPLAVSYPAEGLQAALNCQAAGIQQSGASNGPPRLLPTTHPDCPPV